jgi:hypothetical protein
MCVPVLQIIIDYSVSRRQLDISSTRYLSG